jgi:hypothetical protein
MTRRLVVTLVVLLAASVAVAQPPAPPSTDVVIGRREVVHSMILNEDRPILVSLPPPTRGLPASGSARYPVMVLLDGDWQFEHTVAATRFLAGNGLVPPMIVAGVMNVDRGRDLMPHLVGSGFAEGPSDRFLGFRGTSCRTSTDVPDALHRLLVGHNAGCSRSTPR